MKAAALVLALALGLVVALGAVDAQTGKVYRVGLLASASAAHNQPQMEALRQGLRDLGYEERQNIAIEYRYADDDYERLPSLAKELVALNLDVIVAAGGPPSALALKAATKTIPVVFLGGPAVEAGIVPSIARPGGNLTGVDVYAADLDAKRLELLKEALPKASRVAVLWNPGSETIVARRERVEVAARSLGLRLRFLEARQPSEIDTAFAAMARERPHALLVLANPMLSSQRPRILELVARNRLPAMFQWREFSEGGGLMSYGANILDMYRRAASSVDKILRGAKPADLPIEQPTKYELVVNLKTAKALGLTIPPSILLQADKVIE